MTTSDKITNKCIQHLRNALDARCAADIDNARLDPALMSECFMSIMHELGEYEEMAGNLADIISDAGYEARERLEADEREEAERDHRRAERQETLSLSQMGLR